MGREFDTHYLDVNRLLKQWRWLCSESVTLVARNGFGDLFLRTVEGRVLLLDVGDGTLDQIAATEALAFATKLSNLKKPYELVVYANDVHEVANNRRDRDARVIAWFKRYLR